MSDARRVHLVHLVFTNLAGPGGSGFRHLWTAEWSGHDREPVEGWLQAVAEAATAEPVYAGAPFRAAGVSWRALARAEAGRGRDEFGRSGRLGHALLAEVVEGEALVAGERLLAVADRAWAGEGDEADLGTFWRRCAALEVVAREPRESRAAAVGAGDPLLAHVLVAASAAGAPGEREVGWPDDPRESVAALLRRLDLLPPRLRLSLSWATGSPPPSGTAFVLRRAEAASPAPHDLPPAARDYPALAGRPAGGLADDWSIRSWRELGARVGAGD